MSSMFVNFVSRSGSETDCKEAIKRYRTTIFKNELLYHAENIF